MLTILASVSYKTSLYRKTVTLAVTTHPENKILHQSFHPANNTDHISLIGSLSVCDVVRSVKNHSDFHLLYLCHSFLSTAPSSIICFSLSHFPSHRQTTGRGGNK